MNGDIILEMKGITKEFPGVKALDNVTFQVKKGEIHALVGENGAGKSTLMKVLSGVYPYGTYNGDIIINGKVQTFKTIKDSEKARVAIIYQELALIKEMSICENIFLGNEKNKNGIINWDISFSETTKILKEVKMNANPSTKILNLGVGEQQLVEIAKAIAKNADILILDEPTAALTETEADNLLNILKELKAKGVTCIYISHRLKELFQIADRMTILRDGKTVCTEERKDLTEDKLIAKMVGRELTQIYPKKQRTAQEVVFEVKNWTVYDPSIDEKVNHNINFVAKKGEILGIAGLMGAGRTELAMSIFGVWGRITSGEIFLNGKKLKLKGAKDAISAGISLLSEDRKRYGLVLNQDIKSNISLSSLEKISKFYVINKNEEIKSSNEYSKSLKIKTPSIEQKVCNLSGGNQQKVVIAKWLMTKPKVLILDEPTRGIDVGAKFEIYNIMNELVDNGVCVIMISSDLPEILGMSDRILVMHEGVFNKELLREEATQEKIMYYATGGV
ncbi:MAG: D-xylose ABC transporter ATP-binding protein [Spirochaetes bacterium GWD1_27_9]|nr:MAG: D-xylose ABC transporter ATP-binding protein [Spirochaetes bacterium GWB1_27_13]OHD20414.1 MAG: D-xylose ABC transporter ATP-binding protein [Spirochaetes bacterium GWC1_27_15]OHD31988.1 MAG: D-xylose ABC transporter ATP-binding protein [Spirochaetes bacterium GWD1_27_9]